MDQKQKEDIKRTVSEALRSILSKLKISKPSAKVERHLKKHAKKLADHFKEEIKRLGKKESKDVAKGKTSKTKATKAKKTVGK